jgi:hypothetical protein
MKPFNEASPVTVGEVNVGGYFLHGDVIIQRVASVPENFTDLTVEPNSAAAYGEVTGHVHQFQGVPGVDFDIRVDEAKKERHLRVINPVALKHQEHHALIISPGDYKIGIQREYSPFDKLIRAVAD